jgi:hypothetical protein
MWSASPGAPCIPASSCSLTGNGHGSSLVPPLPPISGVPAVLDKLVGLRRTLKKRSTDVLAYFDRTVNLQQTDRSDQPLA